MSQRILRPNSLAGCTVESKLETERAKIEGFAPRMGERSVTQASVDADVVVRLAIPTVEHPETRWTNDISR